MVMFRRDLGSFARNLEQVVDFIDEMEIAPDHIVSITMSPYGKEVPQLLMNGRRMLDIMNSNADGMRALSLFGFIRGITQDVQSEPGVKMLRLRFNHFDVIAFVREEDVINA